MGIGKRTGGLFKGAMLVLVGAAGAGAAIAAASVPDSSGVIHACVSIQVTGTTTVPIATTGNLRIIDPVRHSRVAPGGSPAGVRRLSSSDLESGGADRTPGPPGKTGTPGAPGPPGKTQTVVGGHTLTLGGGQVITVGAVPSNTLTITTPPSKPSGSTVTLNIDGTTIPIFGFSFVGSSKSTGAGAGRASFNEFVITKQVDKSSPKLALACATGKHFPKVTITLRKAGGTKQQYLTYTLTNAIISSYQTGGSGHNVTPTESLSLNFTKIQFTYSK